jgi:hypothetical protein
MKLPNNVLKSVIERTEQVFKNYVRKPHLSKKDVIGEINDLYDNQKEVIWIENPHQIRNILKNSDNPWVYHYSLNLNWVLFFKILYEEYLFGKDDLDEDISDVYLKTWRLKILFDHADGLIEDGDKVYIVKDDYNLIQKGLDRFTLS